MDGGKGQCEHSGGRFDLPSFSTFPNMVVPLARRDVTKS